jgi:hypothetical protein
MAITGAAKLRFRLLKEKKKPSKEVNEENRLKLLAELTNTIRVYITKNMSKVSGRTIANTLRSLADLGADSHDFHPLLETAAEELRNRPQAFTTQERCMMVGTFAAQRLFPGVIINECINRVRCRL